MAFFDECQTQVINALNAWDFRSWTTTGVLIVERNPMDLIDNMLKENPAGAVMTMPIISVAPQQSDAMFTSLGGFIPRLSTVTGTPLKGMRAMVRFLITAWADEALGGETTAVGLCGEIFDCMVFNCNRLQSYRHLRPMHSDTAFQDHPQLWGSEVIVEGDATINYEAQ